MLKKLPKNKSDVKYINKETGEVDCTYNQCYKKFKESSFIATWTPKWLKEIGRESVSFEYFCHVCTDCGRRQSNAEDRSKSYGSYVRVAICGHPDDVLDYNKIERELK